MSLDHQSLLEKLQRFEGLSSIEKDAVIKEFTKAEKDLGLLKFELERTEKDKSTLSVMLEQSIEDLRKKNRELEIEAALERVRARTMAMHKSDELAETASLLFKQLIDLGIVTNRLYIFIAKDEAGEFEAWGTAEDGANISHKFNVNISQSTAVRKMYDGWKEKMKTLTIDLQGKELEDYIRFLSEVLQAPVTVGHTQKRRVQSIAYFSKGLIGMASPEPQTEETIRLLERFAGVFNQTFIRFLDLQKAEAQAREALIELALERVRARTMAMQKSSEFSEIIEKIYNEFQRLGFNAIAADLMIFTQDATGYDIWISGTVGTEGPYRTSGALLQHPHHLGTVRAWQQKQPHRITELKDDQYQSFFEVSMDKSSGLKEISDDRKKHVLSLNRIIHTEVFTTHGCIRVASLDARTESQLEIQKRFANVFEQSYSRFLDLQNAEAQTREAQIEAALERVRAASMAMHKSEELQGAMNAIIGGLNDLSIEVGTANILIFKDNPQRIEYWTAASTNINYSKGFIVPNSNIPYYTKGLHDARANQQHLFSLSLSQKKKNDLFQYLFTETDFRAVPADRQKFILESAAVEIVVALEASVGIQLTRYSSTPFNAEDTTVLHRFTKVFKQTYTRFLDLQKAEAQTREAKIEASLERVRSKAMAMHNSSDLSQTVDVFFQELKSLDVVPLRCGIGEMDDATRTATLTVTTATKQGESFEILAKVKEEGHPVLENIYSHWKLQEEYHPILQGAAIKAYYQIIKPQVDFPEYPDNSEQHGHHFYFKEGFVFAWTDRALTDEEVNIFRKFTSVISLTYRRYKDLKEAEAQTREAEIQLALERVRARTMAMQHSSELADAAFVVNKQFEELGEQPDELTIGIVNEKEHVIEFWATFQGNFYDRMDKFSCDEPHVIAKLHRSWKEKQSVLIDISGRDLQEYIQYKNSVVRDQQEVKARRLIYCAPFSKGILTLSADEPRPQESISILERFASAIDLIYTRFLDLQKAEAQAREAQIEAALERVRASSMAMHHSDDLQNVIKIICEQLIGLNFLFDSCTLFYIRPDRSIEFWVSTPYQTYPARINVPFIDNKIFHVILQMARENREQFTLQLSRQEKDKFFEHFFSNTIARNIPDERKQYVFNSEGYFSCCLNLKGIFLTVNNYQVKPYDDNEVIIIKRFGNVFSQAYTRFLDLQKAEIQARESKIEAALERVRSRSMAMHTSDELKEVIAVVIEQFKQLGFNLDLANFNYISDSMDWHMWLATPDTAYPELIHLPYIKHPLFDRPIDAYQKGLDFISDILTREEKNFAMDHFYAHTVLSQFDSDERRKYIAEGKGLARSIVFMRHITLTISNFDAIPYTDEQNAILKRFANVFEQSYTRFLDLKKAEAQAKEAKIEAALEKVRAIALSMKEPADMLNVCHTISDQLKLLQFKDLRNVQTIIINEAKYEYINYQYFTPYDKNSVEQIDYRLHPVELELAQKMLSSPDAFYSKVFEGKDLQVWRDHRRATHQLPDPLLDKVDSAFYYFYSIGAGGIGVTAYSELTAEALTVFKRFRNVFELAYRRYIDIELALAQAMEAKIEAALERVRSRTMGMHKSEELLNVIQLLFEQFKYLNFNIDVATFSLNDLDGMVFDFWMATAARTYPVKLKVPLIDHPLFNRVLDAMKKGIEFFSDNSSFEEKNTWLLYFFKSTFAIDEERQQYLLSAPGFARSVAMMKNISLHVVNYSGTPYTEVENAVITRFAKVFEQTYTRFLDLQKAEEQASEAQIEAALERVRSRSLGMHKSEELSDVINVVFEKLNELAIAVDTASIIIPLDNFNGAEFWIANKDRTYSTGIHLDYTDWSVPKDVFDAWKQGLDFFSKQYSVEEKNKWWEFAFQHTEFRHIPEERKKFILSSQFFSFSIAIEKNIGIQLVSYSDSVLSEQKADVLKRFAKVFNQSYIRFLDLQKAEAQAREAQIETALERVRAGTMAMHASTDLLQVIQILSDQLMQLRVLSDGVSFITDSDEKGYNMWLAAPEQSLLTKIYIPRIEDRTTQLYRDALAQGKDFYTYTLTKEEKNRYFKNFFENTELKNTPDSSRQIVYDAPGMSVTLVMLDKIALSVPNFRATPYTDEENTIIRRFAFVFQQSYTRFLDLQKAEAQAREAQIEASLERVRAQSMIMRKPDELIDICKVLFGELLALGFRELRNTQVVIFNDEQKYLLNYDYCDYGVTGLTKVPYDGQLENSNRAAFRADDSFKVTEYSGKGLEEFRILRLKAGYLPDPKLDQANSVFYYFYSIGPGALGVSTFAEISEEHRGILNRFRNVFALAYRRYDDIAKAEAQAREAQIEAALERVRAKAMAMHNSADLSSATNTVFTELQNLGIQPIRAGVGLPSKESRRAQAYGVTSSTEGKSLSLVGWVRLTGHPVLVNIYDKWEAGEDYFPELSGEAMDSYYQQLSEGLSVPIPDSHLAGKQYGHYFQFSVGYLYAWSEAPYNEAEVKILKRFAAIIDLTFRRYVELQQAEANAREALRQASLDRVRAEIASMRTTADLERITPLVWNELTTLGVHFVRCGVFIMDEEREIMHTFLSTPDGKAIAALPIPYDATENVKETVDRWRNNKIYLDQWNEEDFALFAKTLTERGVLSSAEEYLRNAPRGSFFLHYLPFLQGMLYVGNTEKLQEDELQLVQSVADSFSTAYARYEDFNKLEDAKQQIEKTLSDLRQTQTQLIQSEKMASLGELTAGIAHEIQNPLNFVNNFSEVSNELIDEMVEEVRAGNYNGAKTIADDLKQNLDKINHHGKRADSIVKGMLQHSRNSSGQKELTDINALCDEYLRLSFHGLRAKDKSFNAKFKTDFDLTIGKINIVPQEIGRVILNLINNAFYVVTEKRNQNIPGYEPTVVVTTRKKKDSLEIAVSDNGNGVPQKVLDKIFQPFFTTKPTGQGTGLGLSLSYDIVKTHSGEIKVETKEGEGTEFVIQLPMQ